MGLVPTASTRHIVPVMAVLAICAVTAALLKTVPIPRPRHPPPLTRLRRKTPGMIPLTVPEIRRLLAAAFQRPHPPGHATHWLNWRRRHQAARTGSTSTPG